MSGLLACVGKSFVKPQHMIPLKIGLRHDIRLFERKITAGYGRLDFVGAKDGGKVAEGHPCSRHEVDPGPGTRISQGGVYRAPAVPLGVFRGLRRPPCPAGWF